MNQKTVSALNDNRTIPKGRAPRGDCFAVPSSNEIIDGTAPSLNFLREGAEFVCTATCESGPGKLVIQLLAHDMKNPLSSIIGNTQILLMDKREKEEEDILNDVLKSAERLNQIVMNILDRGHMEERDLLLPHKD